jgi:hypothetical protein
VSQDATPLRRALVLAGPRSLDLVVARGVEAATRTELVERARAEQLDLQLRGPRSARDTILCAETSEEVDLVLSQAEARGVPAATMRKLQAAAAARREVLRVRRSLLP